MPRHLFHIELLEEVYLILPASNYKQTAPSNDLVFAHISADGVGYRGNEALINTDAKKIGPQTISVALIDGANERSQGKVRRSARYRQRC